MSSSVKGGGNSTRSSSPESLGPYSAAPPHTKEEEVEVLWSLVREDDDEDLLPPTNGELTPNMSVSRKKKEVGIIDLDLLTEAQTGNKEEEVEVLWPSDNEESNSTLSIPVKEEQVEMVDLDLPTEAQTERNRRPVNGFNRDLFEQLLNNGLRKENIARPSHVMEVEEARPRKRIAIQDKPAEITFNNLMADIRAKRFEPLLHREDVKLDKELLDAAVAQRTPMMLAANVFNYHSSRDKNTEIFQHLDHHPIVDLFKNAFNIAKLYIAKDNELDLNTIEKCLPEDISRYRYSIPGALNDEETRQTLRKDLSVYADDCRNKSLECLRQHVTAIQRRINNKYRGGGVIGLASLTTEQIRSLYGLIFDMHPVWIMTRFKAEESKVVDFASIWAYESEDRLKWRRFYRNMYIDMMTHTWILRVKNGDYKAIVAGFWQNWGSQQKVLDWDMDSAWDLPIQQELLDSGSFYIDDPEEGSGEFVTPN
ncbi:hypothetical protein HYFRA_00010011 [Hymenoscyphus fraxineus]|uniref:Uncharacterized protein n=1 Tax=Hymenoscyphus fraxineus TaxID=746836 RepID=A0A9N9KVB7_9HELO|nr:hypothetical protein HYFRA_00010011 [Hymenoscyphus fraxineus]